MKYPVVAVAQRARAIVSHVLWLCVLASVAIGVGGGVGACKSSAATAPADFCGDAKSSNQKCASPSDCDTTLATTCKSLPSALSASSLAAAQGCLESGVCGVASCISTSAKSATPTATHLKLAADFCTSCAPTLADCQANFYKRGGKGAGLAVLPYAEPIIQAIDDGCTTTSGCQAAFQGCAAGVIAGQVGAALDADTATCVINGFSQDDSSPPVGPNGQPQAVTCTAANCTGCCRDDVCQKGDDVSACGAGATGCQICSGAQQCIGGVCKAPCGPDNCAGCCNGDTCVDGKETATCGKQGAACDHCQGTMVCSNQTCTDGSCIATCTTGCCTAAGCQTGSSATACGTGGGACVTCGSGRACTQAACTLDTTSLWDVYISFAIVPAVDKNGNAWDLMNGLPDPYLFVFTSLGSSSHSGVTSTKTDTTAPFWAETPVTGVAASELLNNTSIEIWDYDETNADDFIGGCQLPLVPALFDGSLQEVVCPATASGVSVTVDYRINPHTGP